MDPIENPATSAEPTEPKGDPKTQAPAAQPKAATPTQDKSADVLISKIEALQADLSKERGTVKTLRAEKDSLAAKVAGFELTAKKTTALSKALSEIGEDFEVTTDKAAELQELVGDLQDSEELDAKVAKFVGLVKTPRNKGGGKITTPTLPASQQPETPKATDVEGLFRLAQTDPEAFRKTVRGGGRSLI